MNIAKKEGISFATDIKVVAQRIPTDDYDLCVIIGNLLDNSLNAARVVASPYPRQIRVEIFTSQLEFVIHIENTRELHKETPNVYLNANELYHGYGITNVENLVKKYNGSYSCFPKDRSFETIIAIPIMNDHLGNKQ